MAETIRKPFRKGRSLMAQEHGDIFAGDDPLNLDRFQPKPAGATDRPGPQELRGIAERTKFVSREGQGTAPRCPYCAAGNIALAGQPR